VFGGTLWKLKQRKWYGEQMKTWYLFAKNEQGNWFFYTSANAVSASEAVWKESSGFYRRYSTGQLRAFSKNNLPWEK
jgi:uncharacterized phage-associated protein